MSTTLTSFADIRTTSLARIRNIVLRTVVLMTAMRWPSNNERRNKRSRNMKLRTSTISGNWARTTVAYVAEPVDPNRPCRRRGWSSISPPTMVMMIFHWRSLLTNTDIALMMYTLGLNWWPPPRRFRPYSAPTGVITRLTAVSPRSYSDDDLWYNALIPITTSTKFCRPQPSTTRWCNVPLRSFLMSRDILGYTVSVSNLTLHRTSCELMPMMTASSHGQPDNDGDDECSNRKLAPVKS